MFWPGNSYSKYCTVYLNSLLRHLCSLPFPLRVTLESIIVLTHILKLPTQWSRGLFQSHGLFRLHGLVTRTRLHPYSIILQLTFCAYFVLMADLCVTFPTYNVNELFCFPLFCWELCFDGPCNTFGAALITERSTYFTFLTAYYPFLHYWPVPQYLG